MTIIPEVGDWVRFYSLGGLIIGQVEYVRDKDGYRYLCTGCGEVRSDYVLEVRRA